MKSANPDQRIPVALLTGFLGSGKTTVLNHLVQQRFAGTWRTPCAMPCGDLPEATKLGSTGW